MTLSKIDTASSLPVLNTATTTTIYDHFRWRPQFHDRIIRDRVTLPTVCAYIANNPAKWEK